MEATNTSHASASAQRGARVRFPPPLVFVGSTLLGVAFDRFVQALAWPMQTRLIGAAVLAAGIALVASARVWFFRTKQNPVPWTPTPSLIVEGPYRFTRNPMYVGVTVIQVALGLLLRIPWISLLAPASLLAVHFIAIVREETYLAAKFGAPYEAYRARVRRYL